MARKVHCSHCNSPVEIGESLLSPAFRCPVCNNLIRLEVKPNVTLPLTPPEKDTPPLPPTQKGPSTAKADSNRMLWGLLLVACVLHALFSREGIYYPRSWANPLNEFVLMMMYALPGIGLSIVCFVALFWGLTARPRPKRAPLAYYVWAVWLGLLFRLLG